MSKVAAGSFLRIALVFLVLVLRWVSLHLLFCSSFFSPSSCVFVRGLHAVLARSVAVRGSNLNLVVLLLFFLPAYVFVLGLHIVLAIVWP